MHRQKWIGEKKHWSVISDYISSGKADKEFKFFTSLLYCLCVFQLFFLQSACILYCNQERKEKLKRGK